VWEGGGDSYFGGGLLSSGGAASVIRAWQRQTLANLQKRGPEDQKGLSEGKGHLIMTQKQGKARESKERAGRFNTSSLPGGWSRNAVFAVGQEWWNSMKTSASDKLKKSERKRGDISRRGDCAVGKEEL